MSQTCSGCRDGAGFDVPFSMAFQPIFDLGSGAVFAQEALVRGANGEGAYTILSKVDDFNRYAFDQACRVTAIETAARLGLPDTGALLSINFMPNAVYEPAACLRTSLAAASRASFPRENTLFEFTEGEKIEDAGHVERIVVRDVAQPLAVQDRRVGG